MKNYDHLLDQEVKMVVDDGGGEFIGRLWKDRDGFYHAGNSGYRLNSIVSLEPLNKEFVPGCVATWPNGNKVTKDHEYWLSCDRSRVFTDDEIRFTGVPVTWPEKFDEYRIACDPVESPPCCAAIYVPKALVGKKVRVVEL